MSVKLENGKSYEAEIMLVAVGRGPSTANLGYEEQGITMDRGFVLTDERLATNVAGVYAVGDIVPGLQLAHRGFAHGIFVAEEVAHREGRLDRAPVLVARVAAPARRIETTITIREQ